MKNVSVILYINRFIKIWCSLNNKSSCHQNIRIQFSRTNISQAIAKLSVRLVMVKDKSCSSSRKRTAVFYYRLSSHNSSLIFLIKKVRFSNKFQDNGSFFIFNRTDAAFYFSTDNSRFLQIPRKHMFFFVSALTTFVFNFSPDNGCPNSFTGIDWFFFISEIGCFTRHRPLSYISHIDSSCRTIRCIIFFHRHVVFLISS